MKFGDHHDTKQLLQYSWHLRAMTINVASRNEYIPSKYTLSSLQLLERVIVQEFF